MSRPAQRIVALLAAFAVSFALASCGGDDDEGPTTNQVSVETDTGPDGDPALKVDKAAGPADARVPITTEGTPTVIYKAPVRELTEGMRLRAIATVTLTKCAVTDYIPNQRAHTACQGTKEYIYDPVEIQTGFRLVGGDSEPDLSSSAKALGPTEKTSCTTAIHHCTISQEYELTVSKSDLDSGAKWVVFEATASSPQAKGCKPPGASDCNVLAVETQKGQAMYWVQVDGGVKQPSKLPADTTANVPKLKVLINHGNKQDVRDVVYSAELSSSDDFDDLRGAQFEIDSLLKISEKLPQAPDISGYLVLSDSPTGLDGRYLISDSYDPGKTGNAGGNCDGTCENGRAAVATTMLDCDISAGRRYVNLVADSSRAAAKAGETVEVTEGGYVKVTRLFPADVNSEVDTGASCDR